MTAWNRPVKWEKSSIPSLAVVISGTPHIYLYSEWFQAGTDIKTKVLKQVASWRGVSCPWSVWQLVIVETRFLVRGSIKKSITVFYQFNSQSQLEACQATIEHVNEESLQSDFRHEDMVHATWSLQYSVKISPDKQ